MNFKLNRHLRQTLFNICGNKPTVALQKLCAITTQGLISSLTIGLSWGAASPATLAAEQVILRLGPIQQQIAIADLERYAQTGELPDTLKLYAPLLTSQVREVLNRQLQIDPKFADRAIEDLLSSPAGKQLIASLGVAIPNSSIPQLQAALTLAARQANGLSVVSLLRAYPEEEITVDLSSLLAIALQFNPTYLQSQTLSSLLKDELAVANNTPFKPRFDPSLPGSRTVRQQTLFLQDQQRHRTIPVDIYFPQQQTTYRGDISRLDTAPLVVISHGLGANRKSFAYLARHLAAHGLTVAALEHPGSNSSWLARVSNRSSLSQVLPAREFVDRPQDISFLLDELAKLNQQSGLWQGKLNTQQVSVIGHSLGGYTALALAGAEVNIPELRQFCQSANAIIKAPADWLQCAAANLPNRRLQMRDQRVKNAIALNPVVGNLFGKTGLSQVTTPVLLLAGTEDAITPLLNHQLQPFAQLRDPKYLITAIGGTHLSVSDPANLGSSVQDRTLVKERQGEVANSLRQLVQGVSLAFIKQLTPEAKNYQPFLTSAYAQLLSTPTLPLRLNTELPASVNSWTEQNRG